MTVLCLRDYNVLDDPIEIMVRGYELTLRVDDAKKIEVRTGEDKK